MASRGKRYSGIKSVVSPIVTGARCYYITSSTRRYPKPHSRSPNAPGSAAKNGLLAFSASLHTRPALSTTVQLLLQPDLDQRLVGHIAGVGSGFDALPNAGSRGSCWLWTGSSKNSNGALKKTCSASALDTPCFSFFRAFPSSQSKPLILRRSIIFCILPSYTFDDQKSYSLWAMAVSTGPHIPVATMIFVDAHCVQGA